MTSRAEYWKLSESFFEFKKNLKTFTTNIEVIYTILSKQRN